MGGNKEIIQKLVDETGPKQSPETNNLKTQKIKVIDSNGEEIEKEIFVDDKGNIIEEGDINYIDEPFVDEFGITQYRKVPKIKDDSFNKMKEKAEIDQKEISSKKQDHKVLKNVVEIDELGNKKIIQKLVDETEPKQIPETNNLKTQKNKSY